MSPFILWAFLFPHFLDRRYPSSGSSPECNFCGCYNGASESDASVAMHATAYVYSHMPPNVKIIFSGFGVGLQVQTGGVLSSCAPATNPCRRAFIDYEGGPGKSRYSWDPLTTLVAVRGAEAVGCKECTDCDGTVSVDQATGKRFNW